jgi:uncharacterized membrane protein
MISRPATVAVAVLALAPLAVSISVYTQLPEVMASHWGVSGEVDGTGSRSWVAFVVPAITVFLWALFAVLPHIAPQRPELTVGSRHVAGFIIVLLLFFNMIHVQLLLWNLGTEISFAATLPVAIGILFIFIGRLLGHVEPNWVVGIRTYWTLKNPVVWVRTHQRAALLFKILGVIYMAAAFFRGYILLFILLPAVFLALYLPAYSFLLYQKIEQAHERQKP